MQKHIEVPKLAYRPTEAAGALGIGLTSFWKLVSEGKIEARRFGRVTLVPAESLRRLLEAA